MHHFCENPTNLKKYNDIKNSKHNSHTKKNVFSLRGPISPGGRWYKRTICPRSSLRGRYLFIIYLYEYNFIHTKTNHFVKLFCISFFYFDKFNFSFYQKSTHLNCQYLCLSIIFIYLKSKTSIYKQHCSVIFILILGK